MSHHHLQGLRPGARRTANVDAPSRLRSSLGPGQPLSAREQARFGSSFGHDFSQVRVHADSRAGQAASALGAKAFAAGHDIVFAPGRYRPRTELGARLLAHELAHVAQQQRGGAAGAAQAEAQARGAADRVAQGRSVAPQALGGAPQGLYCDPDDDKRMPEDTSATTLPPMPDLRLKTLPPIDLLKARSSFDSHGHRMSLRDVGDMSAEWRRGSELLDTLGIDDRFKLWFITKNWILNKGLQLQLDDRFQRENPNSWDHMERDWKNANPGEWHTPTIPIFDIDWFRGTGGRKKR
jgi:hypothetical protein